ncbi:MAG: BCAM0308 family protein [Pseudomonadota bacterium]
MTGPRKSTEYQHQGRRDKLIREMEHDPYKSKRKLPEPTVCPDCRAVYHKGRWTWEAAQAGAHEELCPACHRIRDRVPAGFLTLGGPFVAQHETEIMHLVHNVEQQHKKEHPMQRIMDVREEEGNTVITFTDPHLARAAGEALHHAYQGALNFQYTDEDVLLRVSWSR